MRENGNCVQWKGMQGDKPSLAAELPDSSSDIIVRFSIALSI